MTAHALAGEKEKCFQQGINDYLAKPFSENDLLFKIAQCIKDEEPADESAINHTPVNIIDLTFLKKQTRNNATAIQEMIRIFKEENPKDLLTLQSAIAESDFSKIYKTAHSLKSETSMFGLRPLVSHDLTSIEELARANSELDGIEKCFNRIKEVCNQAFNELESVEIS